MADKFTHHTESPTEINISIAHLKSVYKIESADIHEQTIPKQTLNENTNVIKTSAKADNITSDSINDITSKDHVKSTSVKAGNTTPDEMIDKAPNSHEKNDKRANLKENIKPQADTQDDITSQMIQQILEPFGNRIDVLENSVLQLTNTFANYCTLKGEIKNEVTEIFGKIQAQIRSLDNLAPAKIQEKTLKEKQVIIDTLNKKIDKMTKDHIDEKTQIVSKSEAEKVEWKNIIESIRRDLKRKMKRSKILRIDIMPPLYDRSEGVWSKVDYERAKVLPETLNNENEDTEDQNRQVESKQKENVEDRDFVDSHISRHKRPCDVIMIHDSICHDIDMRRLINGSNMSGKKITAYTIQQAAEVINKIDRADTLILHVGVNDLKKHNVEESFPQYVSLVNSALSVTNNLILSLMTPSAADFLNDKISTMNNLIASEFGKSVKIVLCLNNNFCRQGKILHQLYWNDTKLSRDQGVKVLASNLRRTIFSRDDSVNTNNSQMPKRQSYDRQHQNRAYANKSLYQRPSHNTHRGNVFKNPRSAQFQSDNNLMNSLASALLSVLSG
ncbi:unnamed protein product [Mytilus coruscus]|uniref:Uncharacterized protein n=1 Tax=Mytilus coruscus TaxID=42192 RepID=A0A6J8B5A5_MYTCO|nr:unnamed protein product [Mytilus coruscus]